MVKLEELQKRGYGGFVKDRLFFAGQLHQLWGARLLGNSHISEGLAAMQSRALLLSSHMAQMEMASTCIQCSETGNGGCCSYYMMAETDTIQLLMNMLVGVDVAMVRQDEVECSFLGNCGCIFPFKPMFCLNYNCQRIEDSCDFEDLRELEKLAAGLLRKQYEVEMMIIAEITRYGRGCVFVEEKSV